VAQRFGGNVKHRLLRFDQGIQAALQRLSARRRHTELFFGGLLCGFMLLCIMIKRLFVQCNGVLHSLLEHAGYTFDDLSGRAATLIRQIGEGMGLFHRQVDDALLGLDIAFDILGKEAEPEQSWSVGNGTESLLPGKKRTHIEQGGGKQRVDKHHASGKLTVRERVNG
jgi:hypothetical protein